MTSCFCRRKHTGLHHQSERIHDKSGVLDFAVLHSVDDAPDFHGPPRGGHAKKLHPMRASALEELHDEEHPREADDASEQGASLPDNVIPTPRNSEK